MAAVLGSHGTLRKAVLVIADARSAEDAMIMRPGLVMRNVAPTGPYKYRTTPIQNAWGQVLNIVN